MIFSFKDDMLFIKIFNILKQIACENEFITNRNFKKALDSHTHLTAVTRAPPSVPDFVNYAISYVWLMYVVHQQKLIFNKKDSKFNQISLQGWKGDDYKKIERFDN